MRDLIINYLGYFIQEIDKYTDQYRLKISKVEYECTINTIDTLSGIYRRRIAELNKCKETLSNTINDLKVESNVSEEYYTDYISNIVPISTAVGIRLIKFSDDKWKCLYRKTKIINILNDQDL